MAPKWRALILASAGASGAWLALSGVSPPYRPNVPLLTLALALASSFLLMVFRTAGLRGEFPALLGTLWLGLNSSNSNLVDTSVRSPLLICLLGVMAAFAGYQYFPNLRRYGFFLAPALGAAFVHRASLVFSPLLFLYCFQVEGNGRMAALVPSLLRSIPALVATLISLRVASVSTTGEFGWLEGGVLVFVAISGRYKAVSFGLLWFLCWRLAAPEMPLAANIGIAVAGGWLVAKAAEKLPSAGLRLGVAACMILLVADASSVVREAEQAFDRTPLAVAQPDAPALVDLSLELYRAGRFEECAAASRAAIRLQPNFAAAWNNLAAALVNQKQWDEAIRAAQRALILQPDFELARNNLTGALEEKAKVRRK